MVVVNKAVDEINNFAFSKFMPSHLVHSRRRLDLVAVNNIPTTRKNTIVELRRRMNLLGNGGILFIAVILSWLYFRTYVQPTTTPMIVAVLGGTGSQGKGAIDMLLSNNNQVIIRTMTRNVSSPEAQALMQRGVEVMSGSVHNERDLTQLLQGATHVFAVTFSDFEQGRELKSGQLLGKMISRTQSITSVVFSGGQRTGIAVLDTKADIEEELKGQIANEEAMNHLKFVLFLHSSFFYENLITKTGTKRVFKTDDGSIVFKAPLPKDLSVPMVSSYDIGRAAGYAFLYPDKFQSYAAVGRSQSVKLFQAQPIQLVGQVASGDTFAEQFTLQSKDLGLAATYEASGANRTTLSQQLPPKEAAALELMYQWFEKMADQTKDSHKNVDLCSKLFPGIVRNVHHWMKDEGHSKILKLLSV